VANGSDIVIQYEVKMEELLACGGAYVKVLRADDDLDLSQLSNETPYVIMFGPDKCGSDSKVHFILKHQNPVNKEWSEHHFSGELKPKLDRSTHMYTLVIRSDNKFEIHIDTKPVAHGNLLHNLVPPINPPEEIDDPTDFKPSDWVDEEFIPDVTAVKPDDWDETQPRKIPSGPQDKPGDWNDELPAMIPDPLASKPTDWDDEEVSCD
jgi:calnexin